MKSVRAIVTTLIWILAGCYLLPALLLRIPTVQEYVGEQVAETVSEKLGTNVEVKRVDIVLNRIIVDGLRIDDQERQPMLQATRVAAKIDLPLLLQGQVRIASAQLFGLDARLYQKTAEAQPNFQFALDSLASKDHKEPSRLDLAIQSLVVRNGNIRYDQLWKPQSNGLSAAHLHLSRVSGHFILHSLTPDNLHLTVKKLSFSEQSGFTVDALSLALQADKGQATLRDFTLRMPHSTISLPSVSVSYPLKKGKPDWQAAQAHATIAPSRIMFADMAFLAPPLKNNQRTVALQGRATVSDATLRMERVRVESKALLTLEGSGWVSLRNATKAWGVRMATLQTDLPQLSSFLSTLTHGRTVLPQIALHLGKTAWKGFAENRDGQMKAKGTLASEAGTVRLDITMRGKDVTGRVDTEGFELGRLTGNPDWGRLAATIQARATLPERLSQLRLTAKATIPFIDFKGYRYQRIVLDGSLDNDLFDGHLGIDDPNGRIHFSGKAAHILALLNKENDTRVAVDATLTVDHTHPSRLQLTDALGNRMLSFTVHAKGSGSSLDDLNGILDVRDFDMRQPGEHYALPYLHAEVSNGVVNRSLQVQTDFARVKIGGQYDYKTLVNSLRNAVGHYLPSVVAPVGLSTNDHAVIAATLSDTPLLRQLLHLPLTLHAPMDIDGAINGHTARLNLHAPELTVSGQQINRVAVSLQAADSLHLDFAANRIDQAGRTTTVGGSVTAKDDHLHPHITASLEGKVPVWAQVDGVIAFAKEQGMLVSRIHLNPSKVTVDTLHFDVLASDITYAHHRLDIDHFEVSNNNQFISINGQTTGSEDDSLKVTLQNINVPYILDLVHFKSVSFDGTASGTAYVKKFFTQPTLNAHLRVDDFKFEEGSMGTLYANVNLANGRVNIDAKADDGPDAHTDINGFVSIKDNYIDLPIHANNSRLDFIRSFTNSFLDSVQLRGNGWVRVIGPLSEVNLTGDMRATGSAHVTSLNTTYRMRNAQVLLTPNEITFMGDTIRDREGHYGLITGGLHHNALRHLTYDINIEARNLLAYDFPKADLQSSFWGVVYATGTCAIHGRPGETTMDIEASPNPRSFIEYNAAQQGAVGSNDFIQWMTAQDDSTLTDSLETKDKGAKGALSTDKGRDIPSDLRINLLVNANPDFTLRVLMDAASGDNIALRGNGVIRANWFNKGAFQMFGNYAVENGSYNLTIQNIIKRSFLFQPGSSIAFGGDPFAALLDLKARYTLNSVPLSDLQMGQSFKSNNIRVNCLMDISGTPESPQVTFGLDLPTLSADAQQMVRSVINSQEDMNQQVLYLLAVGRFYTQGANNALQEQQAQSQTSLAMQSVLSGTLSQQISTVLSNVVRSDNWSFGANISTGDEGFSNAEYEGLLNGRLLNNRLLINGEFGYRDNAATDNASFIGDFDIRYLFTPNGNLAIRFYNQNNDRYFTRNSLTTQGIGLIIKKDFTNLQDLFGRRRRSWEMRGGKRAKGSWMRKLGKTKNVKNP